MTITSPQSALLLGAGVSAPFGMPLGAQLVDSIAKQIQRELSRTKTKNNFGSLEFLHPSQFMRWIEDPELWLKQPLFTSTLWHFVGEGGLSAASIASAHVALSKLYDLLQNQTAETIDAFIAENQTAAPFAKIAVAATMLAKTYALSDGRLVLRPLGARYLPALTPNTPDERNWIHLLINIIRHGIDRGDVTQENKIKIITFNYDCILEHVFAQQFANRERELLPFREYIEVVHVHGKFEGLPSQCVNPAKLACEWASGICVVNETTPPVLVSADRIRAKEILAEAKHVYAIGFSFAGPNCRLVGLVADIGRPGARLTYCNYDGDRGVKEAAARYASAYNHTEFAGDWRRPLSVTAFIKGGHLGEPPG